MIIHPDDIETFKKAEQLAFRLAKSIGKTCTIEPKKRPIYGNAFGLCYVDDRKISIVFRWKDRQSDGGQWWNKPLDWKTVRETIAHEIAHLIYGNHGKEFKLLEKKLIELSEQIG